MKMRIPSGYGTTHIEDDSHPLYWLKFKIILSALLFNKKVDNHLILYFQVQVTTLNLSINILKLKELCTEQNLKAVQFIFHPYILYIHCHLSKELLD